jgi:DNA-binding NtrC family response regulator
MTSSPKVDQASLKGTRILVADDEILIALDVEATLIDAGAEIAGPCTTVAAALAIAKEEQISAAMLDIRLGRETTEAVAEVLIDRGIPFVFYSGQVLPEGVRAKMPNSTVISKPADQHVLVETLAALIKPPDGR